MKVRQLGGVAIPKLEKTLFPLLIYFSFVAILLLFTMITNFNLTGYHYYLNEESMSLTIEKGFVLKEIYNAQVTPIQAIKMLLPINEANDMWKLNIYLLSTFIAVLFYKSYWPVKNLKMYVVFYFLCFTTFIIWNIIVHIEIMENISDALNNF